MMMKLKITLVAGMVAMSFNSTASTFDAAVSVHNQAQTNLQGAKSYRDQAALRAAAAQQNYTNNPTRNNGIIAANHASAYGDAAINASKKQAIADHIAANVTGSSLRDQISQQQARSGMSNQTPPTPASQLPAQPSVDPAAYRSVVTDAQARVISSQTPPAPASQPAAQPSVDPATYRSVVTDAQARVINSQTPPAPASQPAAQPSVDPSAYRNAIIAAQAKVIGSQTPAMPTQTPQITGTSYRSGIVAMQSVAMSNIAQSNPSVPPPSVISIEKSATPAATGSINSDAGALKPTTPVSVTVNGVTQITTAGEIAKIDPSVQVSVPHIDAIIGSPNCNANGHDKSSSVRGGTGNGGQNAANTRSGVSHGFGDNHVGGGSAQSGSRNIGHW